MSFLFPGMLWALPLVAAPIIIHLLNRQRYQRVDFGAMEFLRKAIRRTRRRVRLEDWLLLALRTLAVLFLILGLARPTLGPDSLLGSRPPRALIMIVDYSMSMNRRVDGLSALDRTIEKIRTQLGDLDPARGDRAALILAGPTATRPAYGDPGEVRLALDELEAAPAGESAMASALEIARSTADTLESESGLAPSIVVYSDFQATTWPLDGAIGEIFQRYAAEGRTLSLQDTGRLGPNTAVTSLEVQPAYLTIGNPAEVRATIRRFGPPISVRATLLLDQTPVYSETFDLGNSAEQEFQFMLQPADIGARSITLKLDSDELSQDDQRQSILHIREALPTLLVGEVAPSNQADGIFDSLARYLDLGANGPLAVEALPPQRLRPEALRSGELLVLADPDSLPVASSQTIKDFVLGGGGLLIAIGPELPESQLNELLDALDASAIRIGDARNAPTDSSASLAILDPAHPSLRLFQDPRWQPLLTEVPFLRYRPLTAPVQSNEFNRVLRFRENAAADLEFGDALLTWKIGAGQIALLSAAPLPGWNLMDQVPGGTLPFLLDLALSLAPRPSHASEIIVGQKLEIEIPKMPTSVLLTDPIGRRIIPTIAAESMPGGRARLPLLESALYAGTWELKASVLEADGLETEFIERVAVNPPTAESDPTLTNLTALHAALPEGSLLQTQDAPTEEDSSALKAEKHLDQLFFALLAACLLLETVLAARLDRRRG